MPEIQKFRRTDRIALLLITVLFAGTALPSASRAQLTLDGTHCVVFPEIFVGELARCVTLRADNSTLTVSLIGRPPNEVQRIELKIDGQLPFQVIDLDARPTVDSQNIGMLITDMNFDGHKDFAVMNTRPPGPTVSYVYFLFDPKTGAFANSPELAEITAPVFDKNKRQIRSQWRDGAARYGRDRYVWQDGKPVLQERIETQRHGETCLQKHFRREDGQLKLQETQICRD